MYMAIWLRPSTRATTPEAIKFTILVQTLPFGHHYYMYILSLSDPCQGVEKILKEIHVYKFYTYDPKYIFTLGKGGWDMKFIISCNCLLTLQMPDANPQQTDSDNQIIHITFSAMLRGVVEMKCIQVYILAYAQIESLKKREIVLNSVYTSYSIGKTFQNVIVSRTSKLFKAL